MAEVQAKLQALSEDYQKLQQGKTSPREGIVIKAHDSFLHDPTDARGK